MQIMRFKKIKDFEINLIMWYFYVIIFIKLIVHFHFHIKKNRKKPEKPRLTIIP